MTLSRLLRMVEESFAPVVARCDQPVWSDPDCGFVRRSVSPPAGALAGEALECMLKPGSNLAYERPPRPGLEHHLLLIEGELAVTVEGRRHALRPGDCLRYRLSGSSAFETPEGCGARYILFMV